jgi:predicted nucleic acid-binding protein
VAEVLVPEIDEEVDRYLKIIGDRFFVPDFDKNTAKIYSRILHGGMEEIKRNYQAIEITKQQMKIDHIIVATARAHKAESIITYDSGLITFVKGIIRTDGLRDTYTFGDAPPPSLFKDL